MFDFINRKNKDLTGNLEEQNAQRPLPGQPENGPAADTPSIDALTAAESGQACSSRAGSKNQGAIPSPRTDAAETDTENRRPEAGGSSTDPKAAEDNPKIGWLGRLKRRWKGTADGDGPETAPAASLDPQSEPASALEAEAPESPAPAAVSLESTPIPAVTKEIGALDAESLKQREEREPEKEDGTADGEGQKDEPSSGEAKRQKEETDLREEESRKNYEELRKEEEREEEEAGTAGDEPEKKAGWFGRLKQKLTSTRDMIAGRMERFLSAVRVIDDDVLDELEEILISSDLGVRTTQDILYKIRGQVAKKELSDVEALKLAIKNRVVEMLSIKKNPIPEASPTVYMVVGVNGVGKTTTIAKLARARKQAGKKVLLAAGDTFRAAAVEQLTIWAERLGVDIVSQPTGADPSAVVFDSLSAAKARNADVVIIDTAGRLHTKVNLMEELKKIKRVANKAHPGSPHETILVLDANTGQNAVRQTEIFHQDIGIDSIIVTKLDGTSKGGVIVSIANEYKIPITHIGLGESLEDLRPFDPEAFAEAILGSR
jgi:fused signal recognition particle receptor